MLYIKYAGVTFTVFPTKSKKIDLLLLYSFFLKSLFINPHSHVQGGEGSK